MLKWHPFNFFSKCVLSVALSWAPTGWAASTETGTSQNQESEPSRSSKSTANRDLCPTALSSWVQDDFENQSSWGLVPFPSSAPSCHLAVTGYQKLLADQNRTRSFPTPEDYAKYLSQHEAAHLSVGFGSVLDKCHGLSRQQQFILQSRFYSSARKIEAVNSAEVEEIAHLDSVLPGQKFLDGVECPASLPSLKTKCDSAWQQVRTCSLSPAQKMAALVSQTQTNLSLILDLKEAHRSCEKQLQKDYNSDTRASGVRPFTAAQTELQKGCESILSLITLKENETPWIRGEEFQRLTSFAYAQANAAGVPFKNALSDSLLDKAITAQLSANRKALSAQYNQNLHDFQCLSQAQDKDCNFRTLSTHLSELPNLPLESPVAKIKSPQDMEADSYLEANRCLTLISEERAQTKEKVDDVFKNAVIAAGTLGIGEVIAGIPVINASNTLMRTRQALLVANSVAGAALTGSALQQNYQICHDETAPQIAIDVQVLSKNNVCSDPVSDYQSMAQTRENNCLMTTLLNVPSVLPFVGAIPSLARSVRAARLESKLGLRQAADVFETANANVQTSFDNPRSFLTPASPPEAPALAEQITRAQTAFASGNHKEFSQASHEAAQSAQKILRSQGVETSLIDSQTGGFTHTYLAVTSSTSESQYAKTITQATKKFGVDVLIDPMSTAMKNGLGSYSGNKVMKLPGLDLLSGNWQQASGTLVHEITHANFADMRVRGLASPFHGYIWLDPAQSKTLGIPGYEKYLSFEELHTWKTQIQNQLRENNPRPLISQSPQTVLAPEKQLDRLAAMSLAVGRETKLSLRALEQSVANVKFHIDPVSNQVYATIPMKDGKGETSIFLLNALNSNRAQRLQLLEKNLQKSYNEATHTLNWALETKGRIEK